MASKRRATGKNKKHRTPRQTSACRPAAPMPRTHAQFAQESEQLAERHPEEREELLREAAEAWLDAGEHERAVALYERLLDPGTGGCREPDLVDAWRISALWDAGREDDARGAAAAFRAAPPGRGCLEHRRRDLRGRGRDREGLGTVHRGMRMGSN